MYLNSKILCKVSKDLRSGVVSMHVKQRVPLRLESFIVLTKDGVCPLYEKALAVDILGGEGLISLQPDAPYSPVGIVGISDGDALLDLPVEMIPREAFDLLFVAAETLKMDVVVEMGFSLGHVNFF